MRKRIAWNKGKKGLVNNGGFKKGHTVPLEWRTKFSKIFTGRKLPKEVIEKISKNHSRHMLGKHHSEESKEKNRQAHLGKKASLETRLKLSELRRGDKGGGWRGGVTPIHETIRKSLEYKLWRESVFKRDNYICVFCGANNKNGNRTTLNADHIKPFALFPELRFAIDNGRTLCVPCHRKTDTWGIKKTNPTNLQ